MRKDSIKKLLEKHLHVRSDLVKLILDKYYTTVPGDADVTFQDIARFLLAQGIELTIYQEMKLTHSDTDLFYLFITGKPFHHSIGLDSKEEKSSTLEQTPQAIRDHFLSSFLDSKSVSILSSCSSALYRETKGLFYWKDKLMTIGVNQEQMKKVIDAKIIQNYKKLYRNILRSNYKYRAILSTWELLCLSGEIPAIEHGIQKEGLMRDTTGVLGRNALHYAAMSGSVEAMKYAIDVLRIPATSMGGDSRNALHYAAWSGSVEAMKYALDVLHIPATSTEDDTGRNALHNAALSGSVEAMKYVIEVLHISSTSDKDGANALHYAAWGGSIEAMKYALDVLHIPATSTEDDTGRNALHNAALSGSVEAMKYVIEVLHISEMSTEKYGANALHYAAWSGSVEAMKYAIEVLHIPATSTSTNGRNALHYAAFSGSVEAVRFVRQLSFEFDLKLEPTVQNNEGQDVFWYADRSNNAAEIRRVLNLPIKEIFPQEVIKKQTGSSAS